MAAKKVIYVGTDNVFSTTLTDSDDDSLILTADPTGTLYTLEGGTVEVAGETWPITLTHAGSGVYTCTLENTISLVDGTSYWFNVVVTTPKDASWWYLLQAQYNNG